VAIVGIDLGTTNSLVAVLGPSGKPMTLANELEEHLTPSAVAFAEDGRLLVGRAARDRLVVAPESGRAFFKRDMGTPATYRFGGRAWTPTECSAAVLKELKRVAEARLGQEVRQAVVTVPAYFHDPQRQATLEAAKIAGLEVDRILNEPTAAALAFGYEAGATERTLVVFDLGGGTFDVTVLEVFEGVVEVRASGGDSRLGGEDYTDALLALASQRLGDPGGPEGRARLRQKVEVAKRHLTERPSVDVSFDGRFATLTREDFQRATAALSGRLLPIVRRCLRDADLEASDVDDVLVVGGASRMTAVVDLVTEAFGRIPNRSLDPDRVVALGAGVQAARAERNEAVKDLVLTDVCPHSLGVEVSKTFGNTHQAGHYLPILDRNVTVPVSRVERLSTLEPAQDQLELKVLQGENRRASENTLLGTLSIKGLRAKPKQKHPGEVDVRFTYDANGILEVDVTVVETGKVHTKVIESRPGALTPKQIEEAIARLQPLKTDPRDLLPNRARLERAHRLYAEVTGHQRSHLSHLIDGFENALAVGSPDEIAWNAAMLDQALGNVYAEEGEDGRGPGG
jgi:molecular chaperone HscC